MKNTTKTKIAFGIMAIGAVLMTVVNILYFKGILTPTTAWLIGGLPGGAGVVGGMIMFNINTIKEIIETKKNESHN